MSLHYRKRGEVWYCYGTVRVGTEVRQVPEHSTGQRSRSLAESTGAAEEARIRREILNGPAARRHTIAEAIASYAGRKKGLGAYDVDRLDDFNNRIGDRLVTEAKAAWADWLSTRGAAMKPATAARSRACLQAALNHAAENLDFPPVKLPSVAQERHERLVYLTMAQQEKLLVSYNRWVYPVAVVMCFNGTRTQELLQIDWRYVDVMAGTMTIMPEEEKTRKGRTFPLHWRSRWVLALLWVAQDKPDSGPVFYSQRRKPYADTRGLGGNPLTKAHQTACERAGVSNFRIHDWRHHWASWLRMKGASDHALEGLAGWSGPKMTRRYAALAPEYLAETIELLNK